jgi:hypothetical protein
MAVIEAHDELLEEPASLLLLEAVLLDDVLEHVTCEPRRVE